jgi:hypothetical protein
MEAKQRNKARTAASPAPPLHVCELCSSDLVQPVEWHEAAPRTWNVTLRCPNCQHDRNGNFSQEVVDELDETLDAGFTTLLAELQELMASNMADEIDRFVSALNAGAILPEDF